MGNGEEEGDSPIERLARLLERAGARVTLDHERSTARPCFFCGATAVRRDLCKVGVWAEDRRGNVRRGDPIERPVCAGCQVAHMGSCGPCENAGDPKK